MKLTMRNYQEEAIQNVFDILDKSDISSAQEMLVMPTGTGKTPTFAEIARRRGRRTLVLAHRDELIRQAVEKISWVWDDAKIGVVQAERHETDGDVTVASVQSLHKKRLERMPTDYGTIITDEAHHATARSYRNIYEFCGVLPEQKNSDVLHVGVTATPNRTDKKALSTIFNGVAFERDILDFIPDYLSDLKIIRRESGIVLDGISRSANDLNCHELSDALNTPDGNKMVVDAYKECASDRQSTLAFCADIAHIHGLVETFQAEGIKAQGIDSSMHITERREVLKSFYDGHIKVIVNCGILVEGFDCPQIDCILLVRPTRSELLLRQMIGRGTRLYPGKDICKVVDIVCVSNRWDLAEPAQLFGFDTSIDEKTSIAEKKEEQESRHRKSWDKVEFSTSVAGVYDTRSPGNLYWQQIRWKGWILRCGEDGELRILPNKGSLTASNLDSYYVQHSCKRITSSGSQRGSQVKIIDDIGLEQAFAFAESFVREHKLDTSIAQPNARWHGDPVTENQLRYIRTLGASEHVKPGLTKREASEIITYYKEYEETK